jgi:hypothetical protein
VCLRADVAGFGATHARIPCINKRMNPFRLAPLAFLIASCAIAAQPLPRSTPEAQGISSAAIREFVEAADKQIHTLHSFMLVRHGHVIAEGWWKPESAEKPHVLWSLSKS